MNSWSDVDPWVWVLLTTVPWIALVFGLWYLRFRSDVKVEINNRERMVVEKAITGDWRVLGPGTHFLEVGENEFETVDLNRETISVPARGEDLPETFRAKDGMRFDIRYRCDMVSGRPFHPETGEIGTLNAAGHFEALDPEDQAAVDPNVVILAVTRIDFDHRKDLVRGFASEAIDATLGQLGADELAIPGDLHAPYSIPNRSIPGSPWGPVHSTAALYEHAGNAIRAFINRRLRGLGISVVGVAITDLAPHDPEVQRSYEEKKRKQNLRKAKDEARQGDVLTHAEGYAVGTDQFGAVAQAEATRDLGRSIAEGATNFANAAADGATNLGNAIGRGLERFGKG